MNFFIDTHSHIYYDEYKYDLPDIISKAEEADIGRIICVGTDIETSYESIRISNEYENVFCTVGCHPHDTSKLKNNYINELEEMCKNPKVVGIGETGLDYYYNHSSKEIQKKAFIEHIELSKDLNLPLVIHNRDSDEDLMEILRKHKPKGVIHCFSGNLEMAREVIKLGMLISFTGIVTFKNYTSFNIIKEINLKNFMLETDSPYLSPVPFRGKRNEPKNVKVIAQKIADFKNVSIEEIKIQTTRNAFRLFHRLK